MVTGPMITQGVEVARAVRARHPGLPIVAGGWHASILPEQTLRSPSFDAVVKGQGEVTFREMVERYARGERDMDGHRRLLLQARPGGGLANPPRGYTDINALPRRPFHLVDFERVRAEVRGPALDPLLHLARLPLGLLVLLERLRLRAQLEAAGRRRRRWGRWRELARRYRLEVVDIIDDNYLVRRDRALAIAEGLLQRGAALRLLHADAHRPDRPPRATTSWRCWPAAACAASSSAWSRARSR